MTKLEVFRRDASVGTHVTLRLTHGNDISGRIDALDDAYIRLRSGGSTVTIFEDLLAGWEVHHASTRDSAASTANPASSSQQSAISTSGIGQGTSRQCAKNEDFQHLDNPYAPFAEGGPVDEPSMFVGRDDLLDRLESSLLSGSGSKSVVVFGQKRAGKSSLIEHLRRRLVRRNDVLPVCFSLQDIAYELSVPALFHRILHGVSEALDELRFDGRDVPDFSPLGIESLRDCPGLRFHENMSSIVRSMRNHPPSFRIVLLVDEFTDIFKAIRSDRISPEFMKAWKAIIEKKYFASVLVGQDVMPAFKKEFPNEFGVTEDLRVTYLDDTAAKSLVQEPIGKERFIGRAVRRLLDLTANSPYYTMMFCARLVDYMNSTRSLVVTEADILAVEKEMLHGERRLTRDKFDNLLTAGDGEQDSGIDPDDTYAVCASIACAGKEAWCPRESMNGEFSSAALDMLLSDLETRDVVERKDTAYRLRVGLFRDWLVLQG